jgi:hypothetical protein
LRRPTCHVSWLAAACSWGAAVHRILLTEAGHQPHRQLGNSIHLIARPPQDAAARPRRCAHGSHGTDAG